MQAQQQTYAKTQRTDVIEARKQRKSEIHEAQSLHARHEAHGA